MSSRMQVCAPTNLLSFVSACQILAAWYECTHVYACLRASAWAVVGISAHVDWWVVLSFTWFTCFFRFVSSSNLPPLLRQGIGPQIDRLGICTHLATFQPPFPSSKCKSMMWGFLKKFIVHEGGAFWFCDVSAGQKIDLWSIIQLLGWTSQCDFSLPLRAVGSTFTVQTIDICIIIAEAQIRWLRAVLVYEILTNYATYGMRLNPVPPVHPISGSTFLFYRKSLQCFRKVGHSRWKKKDGRSMGDGRAAQTGGGICCSDITPMGRIIGIFIGGPTGLTSLKGRV